MFKRILIVDDSVAARMIIKQYLEIVGCRESEFLEVGDGREALGALKEKSVDLIVTDMNMPNMGGSEFISHLKASPKFLKIPVIIVSSAVNEDNRARFMNFGANFVIGKPVSPQLLYKAVSSLDVEGQEA